MNKAVSNTTLWDSVFKTDPTYAKEYKGKGGFKGTALGAMYLVKKATERWGPMGGLWKVAVIEETYVDGAPMTVNGTLVGNEKLHVVRILLTYPLPAGMAEEFGTVESYGQTIVVGTNKWGPFTDEDAPKKSLTDAMTKALSWLGFSADVHMGMFDDNKYVAQVKKEFAEEKAKTDNAVSDTSLETYKNIVKQIDGCGSADEINTVKETAREFFNHMKNGTPGEKKLARELATHIATALKKHTPEQEA